MTLQERIDLYHRTARKMLSPWVRTITGPFRGAVRRCDASGLARCYADDSSRKPILDALARSDGSLLVDL